MSQFYNAQIQIKMPFFCNYFRWMGGSIEFFMLIILTKVIFAKNRFLYPKNRFFEKIDPKGRPKYSSRDEGTKFFFVGYESLRPDLTVDEKWRRFRDYRTSYRLRKFDLKIQKLSRKLWITWYDSYIMTQIMTHIMTHIMSHIMTHIITHIMTHIMTTAFYSLLISDDYRYKPIEHNSMTQNSWVMAHSIEEGWN